MQARLLGLVLGLGLGPLAAQEVSDPPLPRLDAQNLDALLDQVLPGSEELEFRTIPWRATLAEAVRQARAADRPILLWAMNGHPLGCT